MLEIGGHVIISTPEEYGTFGLNNEASYHLWTSTVQSLVSTLFYDDRKWHIEQIVDVGGLIHVLAKKISYMG